MTQTTQDKAKQAAAAKALTFVEDGMVLGLGTGSTADIFLHLLAERMKQESLTITGVPSSKRTAELARRLGIPLFSEGQRVAGEIDLTLDGADEVDPDLNLIKGGGGALWHEKIIAEAAKETIIMADENKKVEVLGRFPLPVEVMPFAARLAAGFLARLLKEAGSQQIYPDLRRSEGGKALRSDEGNFIYDCPFDKIVSPEMLATALDAHPAIVCHGLFLHHASRVIIGLSGGGVELLERKD